MKCFWSKIKLNLAGTAFLIFLVGVAPAIFAQQGPVKSQEVSEIDGQPVLIKHLPDHERVQAQAVFATDKATLVNAVGHQALFDVVQFSAGTEAVTAAYPQGQLVIIEFTNPQSSVEADSKIQEHLAANPQAVVYRRIGNYNAFVLDANDAAAANTLLDEIKYEKTVQWLGEDPFLLRKLERYMMSTSRDIAISTVLVILLGLGASVIVGIAAGFIFFRFRDQKRAGRAAFSDAGGLTRLNLDGLTSETLPK
jgi:hypothetical protein